MDDTTMTKHVFYGLCTLICTSGAAMALPGAQSHNPGYGNPLIEQVNGNHSSCARGPAGWHYHYRGERIACDPRPSGRYWGWTERDGRWGWWHERERRWHH